MGPYHAIMVHFPVAFWIVAAGIIVYRACTDGPLALALDRVLVVMLAIGAAMGLIAYVFGQLVWPPDTLQKTPLGRNHMLGATWTLSCWSAVLYLRWRAGEAVWDGRTNRLVMAIVGALGGTLLAITGTLGGHLHGAPAYLSELLRMVGFDVYTTFYVPTWVLAVIAIAAIAMPVLARIATRAERAGAAS